MILNCGSISIDDYVSDGWTNSGDGFTMKSLAPVVLLCAGILVQGCSIAIRGKDIEPTDLSSLEIGATRAAIEGVLGEPIAHQAMPTGTVATYRYDGGSQGKSLFDPAYRDYLVYYGPFFEPILTPIALVEWQKRIEGQTGSIMIVHGLGEAVEEFTFIHGGESEHVTELFASAVRGDAEGQYGMALITQDGAKASKWMCLAANQGYAAAQFTLGNRAWDRSPSETYRWYSLADANGHEFAAKMKGRVASNMTPEQIAEAERLVEEWVPAPASCDAEAAKSS